MLSGGTDTLYRQVLAAGHQHYARIDVLSGTGELLNSLIPKQFTGQPEGGLVFTSGSVSATLNSRVSRNLTFTVPSDLFPYGERDLLAPFGNRINAYRGVTLGDGSDPYVWQVFSGRIQDVRASSGGECLVNCSDRAQDVLDVAFQSPQNSQAGFSVFDEWQRLIVDAVPDATFGASEFFPKTVEPLTWQFDRGSALDELATSVGALWYPLANGDFVIRRYPWAVAGNPVFELTDATGGTVNGWQVQRSRRGMFNVVTVTGERLNGDAPVHATASDTVPGSVTNVDGGFGVKSLLERLQTPSTLGGAQGAADALLATYVAPIQEWVVQVVPDAALELGDVGTYVIQGRTVTQVVTDFVLPMDLSGDMSIGSRSLAVGGV